MAGTSNFLGSDSGHGSPGTGSASGHLGCQLGSQLGNQLPGHLVGRLAGAGRADFGNAAISAMSMKWSALHDAASVVCTLAGLAVEIRKAEVRNFPAIMRDTGGWRYDQARQGVDDLAAIMEPGLSALLAVHARGASAGPAAMALWQEFLAARSALLALIPPLGIRRQA